MTFFKESLVTTGMVNPRKTRRKAAIFNSYGLLKNSKQNPAVYNASLHPRGFSEFATTYPSTLRTITHLISRSRYFYCTRERVESVALRSARHSWHQGLFSCVWLREGERSCWEVRRWMGFSLLSFAAAASP